MANGRFKIYTEANISEARNNVLDLGSIGISLSDGALTNLLTPPSNKAYVTSKSRLKNGSVIIADNAKVDERTINLPFHLLANGRDAFYSRYAKFCEILKQGEFVLWCKYAPNMTFKLTYVGCNQFGEFGLKSSNGVKYGSFMLKVIEQDPTNRTEKLDILK